MLALKTFTFNPLQENTYILYNAEKDCCIIDPGCYFPQEREELRAWIEEEGLQPVLLLNTHCHLDHVFGNKFVNDTWGLLPNIHQKEKPVLDRAKQAGQVWNLDFEEYVGDLIYLKEGEHIHLGDSLLKVLFTPGHSPGSVSFYDEKGEYVIAGDVLFREGIGRTDLPGGDYDTLMTSIRDVMFALSDSTVVYPGHGPATTIGHEKTANPFLTD